MIWRVTFRTQVESKERRPRDGRKIRAKEQLKGKMMRASTKKWKRGHINKKFTRINRMV